MFEKPKMSELASRSFTEYQTTRSEDGNAAQIRGVPIVFEQPADISGWFEETIARGAISESVLRDVALFYNHDLNSKPLARTRTGKLKFSIENDGVHMVADVNLERSDVNDMYLAIEDGDIDAMSFMFRIEDEEWTDLDTDYPKRRITRIGYVQEVSIVNYPAYDGTSVAARQNNTLDSDVIVLDNARAKAGITAVDTAGVLALEKLKNQNKIKLGVI